MSALLRIEGLHAGYGDLTILRDVALELEQGEVVSVVGANGAGKTTLLRTIAGLVAPTAGTITFDGEQIGGRRADKVVPSGAVLVPEGRKLFPLLTVAENLRLGAFHKAARRDWQSRLQEMYELFPRLRERANQPAMQLSGGEQQMCAIARGLMSRPRLLMLDEPSLGLAPVVVQQVFDLLRTLPGTGLTVLLVEQNVTEALELSTRGYVLEQGSVVMSGSAEALLGDAGVREAYLGVS